ncbi:MAG: ribosome small subunit-dependent GTPase A [Bacillota bacterium]|nr:ribosome small subunit-dependent GTPase A [Bacillota bacterium]
MRGLIVKGVGGLYFVKCDDQIYECSARGKFRQKGFLTPMVGDYVQIEPIDSSVCAITDILPRKSELVRPSVANIDQLIVTFAVTSPAPDLLLVDKLTVAALMQNISVAICITKSDLKDAKEYENIYKTADFPVVVTNIAADEGFKELAKITKNKISAFAGCSGVGKSTALNAFNEKFVLKTGSVSDKIERGKHTTRHVELLSLEHGGYVLDTPGFSSFEITDTENLMDYFPEFQKVNGSCRFADCTHINEPDCAVKKAVSVGAVSKSRYENYVKIKCFDGKRKGDTK